jgi:hypothetical protein
MAASMAAKLKNDPDLQVKTVRGGLGEFTVYVDDKKEITTSRLWYPNPISVWKKIKALIAI